MGYVSLDVFLPEILQYVNGAPSIMVRTHVRNTIIEFCERTMCLKKQPSSFYLDEEEHSYTLKFDGDRYRAVAIMECQEGEGDNGRPITETTEHWLDATIRNWRNQTGSTARRFFLSDSTNEIRFHPTPTADGDDEIFITANVTIKRDQTEVDEFIWERWEETIQAGALSSLLMIPGATWFNQQLADDMSRKYKRGVRNARKTVLGGNSQQPQGAMPQNYEVVGSNHTDGRSNRWE